MNNNGARSLRQVRRSRSRSKRGVSPVIGVILMVAATIVIAGVVIAMLGGFKAPTASKTVGVITNRINDTAITFTISKIEPVGTTIKYINMTSPITDNTWTTGLTIGSTHTYNNASLKGPAYVVLKATFSDGSSEVVYSSTV